MNLREQLTELEKEELLELLSGLPEDIDGYSLSITKVKVLDGKDFVVGKGMVDIFGIEWIVCYEDLEDGNLYKEVSFRDDNIVYALREMNNFFKK